MATFTIDDAIRANIPESDLPPGWFTMPEATKLQWISNINGGWQPAGPGQVSVDDSMLWPAFASKDGLLSPGEFGDVLGKFLAIIGGAGAANGAFGGLPGAGSEIGAGGAMDMGVGTQGWMDYLNAQAAGGAGASGLGQIIQQLQSLPGGAQIAQTLLGQVLQGGGGAGGTPGVAQGTGGGFDLKSLIPLLGVGSGLGTMFGSTNAVDPNMVKALWQAGQNTYGTSLDPQHALHDRTQQQIVDAARAGQSARGIAMSPIGAGLENDAVRNFNIDWQNQQLARQAQGAQAFAGAGNTAANAGIANNAQAFLQNQTGLNNLTTGLQGLFGGARPGQAAPNLGSPGSNPIGSWLQGLFSGGGGAGSVPPVAPTMPDQGMQWGMPFNYNGMQQDSSYYGGSV